ncbi:hypothetical protein COT44_03740 [Candidatus Shapirobacteria bacterium CG08_land_8_20_14_0_20_39_18]|uniref:DUF2207 domain-containing protein n=1 Tax=Candidatus Shapirobacteria bacterium CG08_land_8_20_14_0_20_39_18 TaxID=1974883 RepID=A0A2M6XCC6_9BACT|nr:MAG: hypothetical protein COT44_03740 [Candidatus Shapirobacteria bacterium CG08_land_8_20_14_0_20_39_18]PIY65597.1 MAG: hypothetical protein COY91_02315 [Candidatus Shapirobacteria bacterium CG_4_10_14_0_8_um_filter_39_15]PJE67966.1 MAG: hypothetical protein COU94_04340 [Candidatus Shapirobacteria bacterium CG10_big_fil_rev_8_21_14_0_10_38_8]
MKRIFLLFFSIILALTLLLSSKLCLSLAPIVYAKDYSILSADFQVQLDSDGSADVIEKRTYNFNGSYSWVDEWIPLKSRISDIGY